MRVSNETLPIKARSSFDRDRDELEGKLAVIVGRGVIETSPGREIGAEPEALPQAAGTKKAKAILATEADIAAIVGGVEVLVIFENSAGRPAAIQVVVLVDAAYIGTDEQIVGAKQIGPHLDGIPPPKLRFERAAPTIDVAVGMGESEDPLATKPVEGSTTTQPPLQLLPSLSSRLDQKPLSEPLTR